MITKKDEIIVEELRQNFPFLKKSKIIYFDSAATALKPNSMIEALKDYYENYSFNIMRSNNKHVDILNAKFTNAIKTIARFLNCDTEELVFTYNATFASNEITSLLANYVNKGDEIIISNYEHASNFLPWVKLARAKELIIKKYAIDKNGIINIDSLAKLITNKTKIMIFSSAINFLGVQQDVSKITQLLEKYNIISVVDAAQSVGYHRIDVRKWNCDFMFFSAHKLLGPTGLGIMFAKKDYLTKNIPTILGGGIANNYTDQEVTFKKLPHKFMAGTPNISAILALAKSIEFVIKYDIDWIANYVIELKQYLEEKLSQIPFVTLINPFQKSHILLFNILGVNPFQVERYLGDQNIVVRSGMFCSKIINEFLKNNIGVVRVSLHFYNSKFEIDEFFKIIKQTKPFEITEKYPELSLKSCLDEF